MQRGLLVSARAVPIQFVTGALICIERGGAERPGALGGWEGMEGGEART